MEEDNFSSSMNKIRAMMRQNVRHKRKDFRINDADDDMRMKHAKEELLELTHEPDDISELADVMAILLHHMLAKKWTAEQVDQEICRKLDERFTFGDYHVPDILH